MFEEKNTDNKEQSYYSLKKMYTILSNEILITFGRKYINIFKKDQNSEYIKHQEFINPNWAEITLIKELHNIPDNFAACGWYGFMIFKKTLDDKYEMELELNDSNGISQIGDFMEIKGKERSFILCGRNNIFIIKDKNILNKFNFQEEDCKYWIYSNYICEFKEDLFFVSGERYLTLINTNDNTIKQIEYFKKDKTDKGLDRSKIYKYYDDSIFVLSKKGIFIFQIFENEKIQENIRIITGIEFYNGFDYDEKSIFYQKKGCLYELQLNDKFLKKK